MTSASPPEPLTVICMKWGTKYGPEDVNILFRMVSRHLTLPFRFVCFTDNGAGIDPAVECRPLPEIDVPDAQRHVSWRKIGLFRADLLDGAGRALFLDLDVVVTDSLDEFATHTDKLGMPENWLQPGKGIGHMAAFTFTIGTLSYVFDRYVETRDTLFARFSSAQKFVSHTTTARGDLIFFPKDWVRSFKIDCMRRGVMNLLARPRLPKGVRVVAFHGDPKPAEAAEGQVAAPWFKRPRPAPWIAEHRQ